MSDAELTVVSYDNSGDKYVLKGKVRDFEVHLPEPYLEGITSWSLLDKVVAIEKPYEIKGYMDTFTIATTKHPVSVERTAQIVAQDKTVEALEVARKRVGAPESAKFHLSLLLRDKGMYVSSLDKPQPVTVTFF